MFWCWLLLCIYTDGLCYNMMQQLMLKLALLPVWQSLRQIVRHDQLSMHKVCKVGNVNRTRLAIMTVSLILEILCNPLGKIQRLQTRRFEGCKVPPKERSCEVLVSFGFIWYLLNQLCIKSICTQTISQMALGALACPSGRISSASFSERLG